ncbi:MAG: RNA polymerase sigma factor [Candidatus Hinthialibacter sp.]
MQHEISSDLDISAGFRRGERWAFEAAAEKHFASIVHFVAHLIQDRDRAVDLTQEAFFLACRAHEKVDPHRPLAPWLFQIARNLAYKDYNKRKKEQSISLNFLMEESDGVMSNPDITPRKESIRREMYGRIQRALDRLAPKYRDIITLRLIQGLPSDQVSELLNIPVSTVNTRIHRALKTLRRYARQEGIEEEELFS